MSAPNVPAPERVLSAEQGMSSLEVHPSSSHDERDLDQFEAVQLWRSFSHFYKVPGEVLGAGMSGKVRLAVNRRTGRQAALKTFRLSEMCRRMLRDFEREVRIQGSLQHPNVARLEDVYASDRHACLLVEFLEGGEVYEHLESQGPLDESQAARVIAQLLRAVEHLHAQGFVHRDIKLENIMYAGPDKDIVKLIDFGLSVCWRDGNAPMTRTCGTEGYMAPEVEKQSYTNVADLWSLGVVAHALLTGDMVGRATNWSALFSKRLARCSPQAQSFVKALLVVDPAVRLTAEQALEHCWMRDCDAGAGAALARSSQDARRYARQRIARQGLTQKEPARALDRQQTLWPLRGGGDGSAANGADQAKARDGFSNIHPEIVWADASSCREGRSLPTPIQGPSRSQGGSSGQGRRWPWQRQRTAPEPEPPVSPTTPKPAELRKRAIWPALSRWIPTLRRGARQKVSDAAGF